MTAFDTAWGLVKADTGMWEEIYAPMLAQTTGMGELDSARFPSDFVPTKIAMDNIRARADASSDYDSEEFMERLHRNTGNDDFDVDSLVESILEHGFNPLMSEDQGWNRSGRPDPSFDFNRNLTQQYEGNHRILALNKLGAPYVPYMGMWNNYIGEEPRGRKIAHPFPLGEEFKHVLDNAEGYSLGERLKGKMMVPPSYIYGRELVPGMGRLLPMNPVTGEPINLLTEYDEDDDWGEPIDAHINRNRREPIDVFNAASVNRNQKIVARERALKQAKRNWSNRPSWRRVFE